MIGKIILAKSLLSCSCASIIALFLDRVALRGLVILLSVSGGDPALRWDNNNYRQNQYKGMAAYFCGHDTACLVRP